MNFFAHKADDGDRIFQMAAMVDVVFILLAFFVMASHFRSPERDFSMDYTDAPQPGDGAVSTDLPSHVPVRLKRSGPGVEITIGGAALGVDNFDGIRAKLTEINMPAIGVRLLTEADVSVDQWARAIDAILSSPMKRLSIPALKSDPIPTRTGGPGR